MKIEHNNENIRYLLSNEELKNGDKVYPLTRGRCTAEGEYLISSIDFSNPISDFPDDPHTIKDMDYSKGKNKPYEVHTSHGFGPKEIFFKIIKKEKRQQVEDKSIFLRYEWIEIPLIEGTLT